MPNKTIDRSRAIQLGMNTSDLSGTLRLYSDLGFSNAGGHMIWGDLMAIQGLPASARGVMWWLLGARKRAQLEIFHLDNPVQRPLPSDWRACDIGWTRFGIALSDLDAAKVVLANWNIPITAEVTDKNGTRRLSYRDPFVGCFVELVEGYDLLVDGEAPRHEGIDPVILYATQSVSNLEEAKARYVGFLDQQVSETNNIHHAEHEVLWNLAGASSKSFLINDGNFVLEVVQYLDPVGRARPEDYTVADQGLLNVAMASYSCDVTEQAFERVEQAGHACSEMIRLGPTCGAYVLDPDLMLELCAVPTELETAFGYHPTAPFFGQTQEQAPES